MKAKKNKQISGDVTFEKIEHNKFTYHKVCNQMKTTIDELFDMPNHRTSMLIYFLYQNKGTLSQRAREKEFKAITSKECRQLEKLYKRIFLEPV